MATTKKAAKKTAPKARQNKSGKQASNAKKKTGKAGNGLSEMLGLAIPAALSSLLPSESVMVETFITSASTGEKVKIIAGGDGGNAKAAMQRAFKNLDESVKEFKRLDTISVKEKQLFDHFAGKPDAVLGEEALAALEAEVKALKEA